jgi:hypothetical protein
MGSNWITAYTSADYRSSRFDEPDRHWLELQRRLNRWSGASTWQRLEQLGQIAKTDRVGS